MARKKDDTSESESSDSEEDESSSSGSGSDSDSDSGSDSGSGSSSSGSSGESSDSTESGSSSDDSDSEQAIIKKVLKGHGLQKHLKSLKRVKTVKAAKKLDDKALQKLGIDSAEERKKIIKCFRKNDDLDSSSDSESSSDYSSDGSDEEQEQIFQILRQLQLKRYITNFKRGRIDGFDKAYKLTENKLRKLGVTIPSHRRKILHVLKKKKNGKVSSDEEDETRIVRILRGVEMEEYVKNLQKIRVVDLESAYKLNDKKLKRAGIEKGSHRRKIIRTFQKYKESHEDDVDIGASIVQKLVIKAGMKKHYPLFKKKEIDTINKAKKLDHKDLREMGINLYRERRDIMEQFEKYEGGEISSASSSSSELAEESNPVHEVLRECYMTRHIKDFDKAGITTIRAARRLSQTKLRSMGVPLYLQREKLINGFKNFKPRNKAILRILIDANLARHADEFEKLLDIEEAKNLTHADLRGMGINLYGQRDRLIKAFAAYEPKKRKKKRKKKGSGSDSDSDSSSGGELNPVEEVLMDLKLHRFISAFEGVKSIPQARALTHNQLRNRGLKLYGQRERLMKAFEDYKKPSKK